MLGILLIYFIWKNFADLAVQYDKSKWGFGILGIVVYYAGTAFGGVILGFLTPELFEDNTGNSLLLGIIALPFGLFFCVIFYYLLKKTWKKNHVDMYDEIERIGENANENIHSSNTEEIKSQL